MSVSVEVDSLSEKEEKRLSVRFSRYLRDFNWIMDNMGILLQKYPDMYIAVKDQSVDFSDTTMQGIVEKMNKRTVKVGDYVIEFIPTEKISYLL